MKIRCPNALLYIAFGVALGNVSIILRSPAVWLQPDITHINVENAKESWTGNGAANIDGTTAGTTGRNRTLKGNPNLSWCPNAICHQSPLCRPCDQRFLFIISTGRAASTTLLVMLNFLPNVRLSGENYNVLYHASRMEKHLFRKPFSRSLNGDLSKRTSAAPRWGPWRHHEIPAQAMACPVQRVLSTINPPPSNFLKRLGQPGTPNLDEYDRSHILGAKMIRIPSGEWSAGEAAKFFLWNFPCAKYLVNMRSDVWAEMKSQMKNFPHRKKKATSNVLSSLRSDHEFLTNFSHELDEDKAIIMEMEEWTQNVTKLNEAIAWMGFDDCYFERVQHQNENDYTRDKSDPHLRGSCTLE